MSRTFDIAVRFRFSLVLDIFIAALYNIIAFIYVRSTSLLGSVYIQIRKTFNRTVRNKSFAYEYDLSRHGKSHDAVKVPCTLCTKVFFQKPCLKRHEKKYSL